MDKSKRENSPRLGERLAELGKFCAAFEAEGFQFGTLRGGEQVSPGVFQMPHFQLNSTVQNFLQHCYDDGWIQEDFNWPEWAESAEAVALRDKPDTLAKASPDQLAKLLTALIRQERFCEGTLADAHKSGLLLTILRRARDLARIERLNEAHVRPLMDLIRGWETAERKFPSVDPKDGGVNAKVLFLQHTPGRKAVGSGFVSRDNPDPTARNAGKALDHAGFARTDYLYWNVVPYYISTEDKDGKATGPTGP